MTRISEKFIHLQLQITQERLTLFAELLSRCKRIWLRGFYTRIYR